MDPPLNSLCEEDDSLDRSTKKVKMEPPKVPREEAALTFTAGEGSPEGCPNENQTMFVQQQETSPNPKPSYKDMVMALETYEENPAEFVRIVSEELYPDWNLSEQEPQDYREFNPNPEIKISLEEYNSWCQSWKTTLIVKLLGKKMGFRFMSKRIQQLWANKGHVSVVDIDADYLSIRFADPDDYKHALYEGPWLIADHYLLVQRWRPKFKPSQDTMRKIAVWARIPQLPMELYNKHFLWRAGQQLDTMLKVDDLTSIHSRGRFARICVEIDLRRQLVLDHEEAYWFHMSRSKWLALGDRNTHYFHQSSLARKSKNRIDALKKDDGSWSYVDQEIKDMGSWKWNLLKDHLSQETQSYLASITPPSLDSGTDKPAWKLEGNGTFTLKSAYSVLHPVEGSDSHQDILFKHLWRWQGPPRITTFLWKLTHGRLLTNLERNQRGMTANSTCPRCNSAPESIMHIVRDCPLVFDLWESIIEPAEWSSHHCFDLVRRIKTILHNNPTFILRHELRESNRAADFLAKLGHSSDSSFRSLLDCPRPLRDIIGEDARGVSFPRMVPVV
ncbi:Reverse transcriptase zinc-binding domain [Sesbania bispinosa]|nr:Reverse transcriptase zinc-binding domain [Sesbania bispinosa]